ncbi:hypothetical protein CNR22_11745 [Sphingobacteriaceae bacterium]|nr:hypothetical protein CNR22_11745 [Sphingobacteriaceae bacterium]
MLAYDKVLLENTDLVTEASALESANFISKEQLQFIEKQLPSYPDTNILVRIGLFILGCFLFSSCSGIVALFTLSSGSFNFGPTLLVYAIFGFIGLEFIIRKWKYFGNGMDNAFLFCSELSLIGSVGFFLGEHDYLAPVFLFATVVGLGCCYRYVDQFSAVVACVGFTAFVARLYFGLGNSLSAFLPFVLMLLSVGYYFLYLKIKDKVSEIFFRCLNVFYVFTLVLFYFSCNYFVVRESSELLLNMYFAPGEEIPFAYLFYAFTILAPLLYIYFGLKSKDRILLWVGFLCMVASLFTIRYYHSVMPVEVACMLGGSILFAIAFFAMQKLKGKASGLTFEPDRFAPADALVNAEVLILLQKYAVKPGAASDYSGADLGGGEFGGGGSGNKF